MKITKRLCVIFALFMAFAFTPSLYLTEAGNVETHIKVNEDSWFDAGDVGIQNGKIVFGDSANATTRIVSSKKVSNMKSSGKEKLMDAEFCIKVTRVEAGKLFGFAFGLEKPSSKIPSADSNLIALKSEDDSFKLVLYSYDKNGSCTVIFEKDGLDAFNKNVKIDLNVNVDGGISVKLDGSVVYENLNAEIDAEGFVGFGQNGKFSAEIRDLRVDAYENVTPMNSDVFETFDNDEYNAELLYSQGKTGYAAPSYVVCEGGKFVFKNAGTGATESYVVSNSPSDVRTYYYNQTSYISTAYIYSNVDLSFDCRFLGENSADSSGFSVILGRDFANESTENLKTEAKDIAEGIKKDLWEIRFGKSDRSIVSDTIAGYIELFNGKNSVDVAEIPKDLNVFSDENYGKPFSVWVQMTDGNLRVYIKFDGSLAFTKVYGYEMSDTPQGCVQIRANGSTEEGIFSTLGNFSVDNLSVTNFDLNAKKKVVKYRSNIWNTDDFVYEDTWNDDDIIKGDAQ